MEIKFFDNRGSWAFSNVKEVVIKEKETTITYVDNNGEIHQETGSTPYTIITKMFNFDDDIPPMEYFENGGI